VATTFQLIGVIRVVGLKELNLSPSPTDPTLENLTL